MEPELKTACLKASAKLGIGLTLVAAVVGIRMVSVTPEGVPASLEKLSQLDSEMAADSAEVERVAAEASGGEGDSMASRLGAGLREHFPGSEPNSRDGDRLVSCRLNGRNQFMRADDCASRGGEPTLLSEDD